MNIILVGAGEVGGHLALNLSGEEHNICVIDSSAATVAELNEKMDLRCFQGDGTLVGTLEEAMVSECDLLMALTAQAPTNLTAASIAKRLGAKQVVARVHSDVQREEWLFSYREHFGIDYLFSSDRLAAVELAKFIRNPDSLVVEELARGRIELQQIVVSSRSVAAGKTLREIALPPRIRIGHIQRAGATIVPAAEETLQASDTVTIFGAPRTLGPVIHMLQPAFASAKQPNVIIAGGTECGVALAQMLEAGNFRVRIFDPDRNTCALLAAQMQNTTVIHADATSLHQLREEQAGEADFLVAATRDDEDNVMACLQANHLGTRHSLALVHRAEYAEVISRTGPRLGILGAVSPREATRRDLMRFVVKDGFRSLMKLDGEVEVFEIPVGEGSPVAGRKICDIPWPVGSGLVALLHGNSACVPAATDEIAEGDTLYAIVSMESRRPFLKLLQA